MPESTSPYRTEFSGAVVWSAEGGRVGIVTCLTCGAAVFLSTLADSLRLHDDWHHTPQSAQSQR